MKSPGSHTGFIIALAWPATYCKQPGSWYDPLMMGLRISKNHYYKAGHAALVLVDASTGKCHYYDFGRYHAPFNHGRVRSAETDLDLEMKTLAVISDDGLSLENFRELLQELQDNKACHGEGTLYASWKRINFQAALNKAEEMQNASPIPYGPFRFRGSNCSRFVKEVILAGKPGWKYSLRLKYFVVLTPTPMNNVNALPHKSIVSASLTEVAFTPDNKPDTSDLKGTLKAPERKQNIPDNAQWLSGEGAGSWFVLRNQNPYLNVTRYSPDGVIECEGLYEPPEGFKFTPDKILQISHPSNCKTISLIDGKNQWQMDRVSDFVKDNADHENHPDTPRIEIISHSND